MEDSSEASSETLGGDHDSGQNTPPSGGNVDTEAGLDEVFELLSNRRRRAALQYLRMATDGTTTLDELATNIAAAENDVEPAQVTSQQRKRVYVSLYQCHLEKLDSCGIIDYQKDRGTIVLRNPDLLEPYLTLSAEESATDTHTETGSQTSSDSNVGLSFYAAAGLVAVLAVGSLGIQQSMVPPLVYGLVSIGALALLGVGCLGHVHPALLGS